MDDVGNIQAMPSPQAWVSSTPAPTPPVQKQFESGEDFQFEDGVLYEFENT